MYEIYFVYFLYTLFCFNELIPYSLNLNPIVEPVKLINDINEPGQTILTPWQIPFLLGTSKTDYVMFPFKEVTYFTKSLLTTNLTYSKIRYNILS